MAAINLKPLRPSNKDRLFDYYGTGAIVATDALVTDVKKYPVGTTYLDKTARVKYYRLAVAGVIGDWASTAALTVLV